MTSYLLERAWVDGAVRDDVLVEIEDGRLTSVTPGATGGTRLRERRAGDEGISFPRVYTTLSTSRVLVMEEVVGRPVSDQEAIDAKFG